MSVTIMYYTYFIHFRICTCMPTLVSYDAHLIGLKFTLPYNYAYAITHICPSISP